MPKLILQIILVLIGIYLLICILLYFNQEKFIFHPTKVPKDFKYDFPHPFKEIYFTASDSTKIHSLYFEVENPKGVVYYLHGNSGDLSGWGDVAGAYLDLGYNILMIDYRGFGKSEGQIHNEKHFYEDAQLGYDFLKASFDENQIIMVGYSVGTGTASHLASTNNPKLLILQSPYYNLTEIMKMRVPFTPTSLLKYKFENAQNISKTKCPVYIFHGDSDLVISYHNSIKLKEHLKEKDEYTTLENFGHNAVNEHPLFLSKLKLIL
ncbi:alpha/beta hydrolase [Moheibacter sediminis]|uniref:Serine aminopeptidase S33 domain-containing protein n=1 Tax=Moheibacter sediminis TaxID=1434700 RepID=A0A1W2AI31_9FLAO|nr:alpha/beta fold hydrolase [Moheibacter sediminis]SMC60091.1 hypothetical protein SAMN06296427_104171 [Moheibacter sediminis]